MKRLFFATLLLFACAAARASQNNYIGIVCKIIPENAAVNYSVVGSGKITIYIDDAEKKLLRANYKEFTGRTEAFTNRIIKITDSTPNAATPSITINRMTGEISMIVKSSSAQLKQISYKGTCEKKQP